jgi:hypothetical protein
VVGGTGLYYDVASFHAALANVDVLIDETYLVVTYSDFLAAYQLTTASPLKFIRTGKVYRNDGLQNPSGAQGTSMHRERERELCVQRGPHALCERAEREHPWCVRWVTRPLAPHAQRWGGAGTRLV